MTNSAFIRWSALVLVVLTAAHAIGAEASGDLLAKPPSITREKGSLRIDFAVRTQCDLEIAIVDNENQEVRHLAAGTVGGDQAAAPLTAKSLSQSLRWDLKDDFGGTVKPRPFKVRFRFGLRAESGSVIAKADEKTIYPEITAEEGKPGPTPKNLDYKPWYIATDKYDDRVYAALPYREGIRYIGATNKTEVIDRKKLDLNSVTIGTNGDVVLATDVRLNRDLKPVSAPEGTNWHTGANRFNYANLYYLRGRPFHEYWGTGTRKYEGLDGRYYLVCPQTIPYLAVFIFDTWEKKRVLHEGYQRWVKDACHFACMRVDTAGNMYFAVGGGPQGEKVNAQYGSILKFDPNSRWEDDVYLPYGADPSDPEELKKGVFWDKVFVPRVTKCYTGIMSIVTIGCCCKAAYFDLDEYGRLYVPDSVNEAIAVFDNAGNPLFKIEKAIAASGGKINLGSPHRVACTRKAIYFTDAINNRVVRAALNYANEAVFPTPTPE